MRLSIKQDVKIQIGDADGVKTFAYKAGEVVEVDADLAALILAQGAADPAPKAEKATKTKAAE